MIFTIFCVFLFQNQLITAVKLWLQASYCSLLLSHLAVSLKLKKIDTSFGRQKATILSMKNEYRKIRFWINSELGEIFGWDKTLHSIIDLFIIKKKTMMQWENQYFTLYSHTLRCLRDKANFFLIYLRFSNIPQHIKIILLILHIFNLRMLFDCLLFKSPSFLAYW